MQRTGQPFRESRVAQAIRITFHFCRRPEETCNQDGSAHPHSLLRSKARPGLQEDLLEKRDGFGTIHVVLPGISHRGLPVVYRLRAAPIVQPCPDAQVAISAAPRACVHSRVRISIPFGQTDVNCFTSAASSPDEAQRNPGSASPQESRILIRSMGATDLAVVPGERAARGLGPITPVAVVRTDRGYGSPLPAFAGTGCAGPTGVV
jgi:hypothetical protein